MKNAFLSVALAIALGSITLVGCATEENTLLVQAEIKGLKKGTLYLQKIEDSVWVNVDSVSVSKSGVSTLKTIVESPELFSLHLDKRDGIDDNDRITFFGEPGVVNIQTSLKKYVFDAQIEGGENQNLYANFQDFKRKFIDQRLDLIKAQIEMQKVGNQDSLEKILQFSENLEKRRYLYVLNYAITNADKELAPFLILSELETITPYMLDTLKSSMTAAVKDSKYGKQILALETAKTE